MTAIELQWDEWGDAKYGFYNCSVLNYSDKGFYFYIQWQQGHCTVEMTSNVYYDDTEKAKAACARTLTEMI